MSNETFYLTSHDEHGTWAELRAGQRLRDLRGPYGAEYWLIDISPPAPGQKYGIGSREMEQIVISARTTGTSLRDKPGPNGIPVYIYRMLGDPPSPAKDEFGIDDLRLIAWGEIFSNSKDALRP